MSEAKTYPKFHYDIMIREGHLDTFGHVNNATYLQIYEEARWDLITKNGFGLKEVHEKKIGPTIVRVEIDFMKELRLRETIRVTTYLQEYETKIGTLIQEMWRGETLCSKMVMKFGLFDMTQRKLIPPTPEWLKGIGATGGHSRS